MPAPGAAARVLYQPVCSLLACRAPLLVCAGGPPKTAAAWLAAVSQAGGFGLLAPGAATAAQWSQALAPLCAEGGAGFGLDLDTALAGTAAGSPACDPTPWYALLDLAVALRLPAVCLPAICPAAGPSQAWERCRAAGLRVLCRVDGAAQALAATQAGASVLIARGAGAAQLSFVLAASALPVLVPLCGPGPGAGSGAEAGAAALAGALSLGAQGGVLAPDAQAMAALPAWLGALLADAALRLGADLWPAPRPQLSSPVCYAEAFEDAHRDAIAPEALLEALQTLLRAERAGARAALALLRTVEQGTALADTLQAVHRGEVRWCGMLMAAVRHLGATPDAATGAFYARLMAVPDLQGRLALLNRGQAWVVRELDGLVPRIADAVLREALQDMLAAHARTIALVERQLV